ncbi:MAG: SRPBCC family protein [Bacteroidota bacterium]
MTNLLKSAFFVSFLLITLTSVAQKKLIQVVTTQQIEVSKEEAFELLRNFERFPEWSPFIVSDPEQKHHVTGEVGQIGSAFHWEGVAEKSEGKQTLTALTDNEYLRMECDITKPFKDQPTFEYQITATATGIEVTQTFELKCSGFSRFMMRLFGVEKQIAATNELGLSRLKTLLEDETQLAASISE